MTRRRRSTLNLPLANDRKCCCKGSCNDNFWQKQLGKRGWNIYLVIWGFSQNLGQLDSPAMIIWLQFKQALELLLQSLVCI